MRRSGLVGRLFPGTGRLQHSRRLLGDESKKDSDPLAFDAVERQKEVDPFRVGYNMGMQSVHLEAIRMKLTDHIELFKSHFHGLTDLLKSNQDQVAQLQGQYSKTVVSEVKESNGQFVAQLTAVERQLRNIEESLKSTVDDRVTGLQRHIDDCFENLKDTVKLGFLVLIFLNLWMFYTISQNHRQLMQNRSLQKFSGFPPRGQK
ncbi:hypothetical protein DQ04_02651030 [Trypanosoma grayi]|uniref:hypothetical protein n=1 Tax=Trypanosoma grayi TaxID=71804 RepID=UPI0004F41A05|nr:hypothetical protein DQ04_02651030 [Trypanosoma grayi]KEG11405.1 hypothetical protein DQ04_02651030 [Trypanosoma grayi]